MVINILAELKRRNVFRVAGLYAVVAWLIMQVAALFEDAMNLPTWFDSTVTAALILCFPIALLLAWAFEMTPDGVKRTESTDAEVMPLVRKMDGFIFVGLVGVFALGLWQQLTKPDVVYKYTKGSFELAVTNPLHTAITHEPVVQINSASIAVLPFQTFLPTAIKPIFLTVLPRKSSMYWCE